MIIGILNTSVLLSDEKLIANYRSSGNSWYVGELYKRYSNPVSALCFSYFKNREETEDAVMEIFELLLVDLKKYDIENFKPWLLRVSKHYCIKKKNKHLKERDNYTSAKKNASDFMELFSVLSLEGIEEDLFERYELILTEAIEQLKDEQRLCIELFFLKDRSYQEISEESGFEINKVKSYIQNGKRNLKLILEQANG